MLAEALGVIVGAALVVGLLAFAMRRDGKGKTLGGPVLLFMILAAILAAILRLVG